MLPIEQTPIEETAETVATSVDYIFEPSREEIAENIVPNTLKIQLYKALLDSHARAWRPDDGDAQGHENVANCCATSS